jgi:hypothetical protein
MMSRRTIDLARIAYHRPEWVGGERARKLRVFSRLSDALNRAEKLRARGYIVTIETTTAEPWRPHEEKPRRPYGGALPAPVDPFEAALDDLLGPPRRPTTTTTSPPQGAPDPRTESA